jgi:RNA polymerase sigma-70 factor (ECF subfamily)
VVRALSFEASYLENTNLRAWLLQILFSVFITRCRRVGRERRALDGLMRDPCAWTTPEQLTSAPGLTQPVLVALERLPVQFSKVVRLVDLEEHSYKDATATLEVPVGTVMSRLFRARRLLAQALAEPVLPQAA